MKRHLAKLGIITVLGMMVTGCVQQPFVPKPLNENARGIATVRSTPYGCKVLGEIEGKDGMTVEPGAIPTGNTRENVREGALNDLRNNAVEVSGKSKKTVLYIIDAKAICYGFADKICPENYPNVDSYRLHAQVFDCGKKE